MALNYYEIEIKAGALTAYDLAFTPNNKFRIISGIVISSNKYCTLYTTGSQVICYMPSSLIQLRTEENLLIATVPEEYLINKPIEISYEHCVLGVASIVRVLNALHYSLSVLQHESILIINPPDQISIQIALNLGMIVFYTGNDEYKIKASKILSIPNNLLNETGGLGVNYILDFNCFHDPALKRNIIDCLGIRGK